MCEKGETMATREEIEDLHTKLEEVLGIDCALTLMELLLWNRWDVDYYPEDHARRSQERLEASERS